MARLTAVKEKTVTAKKPSTRVSKPTAKVVAAQQSKEVSKKRKASGPIKSDPKAKRQKGSASKAAPIEIINDDSNDKEAVAAAAQRIAIRQEKRDLGLVQTTAAEKLKQDWKAPKAFTLPTSWLGEDLLPLPDKEILDKVYCLGLN